MKTINIYACETRAFANSLDTFTHSIQSYFNTIYFDYPNMLRNSHQHFYFSCFFFGLSFSFLDFRIERIDKNMYALERSHPFLFQLTQHDCVIN